MVRNLTAEEIHQFIVSDFRGAWNSIAANHNTTIGRGNFMFGRQAMTLLEFASRLYTNDATGIMQRNFSSELYKLEPKYFTLLPVSCATTKEFILPHVGDKSGRTLLWPLFDLIRHGLAHQYQQIIVDLNDGKHFYISLTGADYGRYLGIATNLQRPREHLGYTFDKDGDLELKIYPDILFLDFEHAINKSGLLLNKGLSFQYLSRPKSKGKAKSKMSDNYYDFNTIQLEKSLRAGNHFRF
ncbi:MAG TPA: hypothetical protein VEL70_02445 [Candidatus Acidoferrum sp.]|nr:hypothetical protein [Candidatus Acidoferrum sp.]